MVRLGLYALAMQLIAFRESRSIEAFQSFSPLKSPLRHDSSQLTPGRILSSELSAVGPSNRESEIRRKIAKLKREGRIKKRGDSIDDEDDEGEFDSLIEAQRKQKPVSEAYQSKIRQKLGDAKSKMLGYSGDGKDGDDEIDVVSDEGSQQDNNSQISRKAQIGSLPEDDDDEDDMKTVTITMDDDVISDNKDKNKPIIDPSLFDSEIEDQEEIEMSEEDLVELVAAKMLEKREKERQEKEAQMKQKAKELLEKLEQEKQEMAKKELEKQSNSQNPTQLTSGVGGSWSKNDNVTNEDMYKPKSGSWGAFPRPRDISKAYGGGRRVGPGFSNEAERLKSEEETRDRLRQYREKVGIEVRSEKENAQKIEEALNIGMAAMQRGMYSTAVSALEKVTKYCSTNSKVGGKVFLELAMAYEAVGKTSEAIAVYTELSTSRMEDIKFSAKRLLYGLEAMQFMRDNVKSSSFSRQKIRSTFIDTTGLDNIARNFDDVYQTAYVDLENNKYKRLTESVVRSAREARQILLRATDAGEVGRMRVVQALRSISRRFDDALMEEMAETPEPVAFINGKPLVVSQSSDYGTSISSASGVSDEFILADAKTMAENLDGEWRLQLLADKRGDGVKFFNSSVSWQSVDMGSMTFSSAGPSGFVTVQQSGKLDFNEKRRILRRNSIEVSGGGVFTGFFGKQKSGATGAVSTPQQVMSVDSVLLITRGVPNRRTKQVDDEKDYFAVWRRVSPGTYSAPKTKSTASSTQQTTAG